MPNVRPPVLAGSWYPAEPAVLRARVQDYLAGADVGARPSGKPRVAVAPHAGYEYSGPTAGKLYGLLAGQVYAAVFILAPSHRARLRRAALTGVDAFATPLGEVPVAGEIVRALADSPCFEIDDRAHALEHAIEIQLPLLQCALPAGTPIVPILVPHLDRDARRRTAAALSRWRDERYLFIVSSDFTHYGADYGYVPFAQDIPHRLEQLDTGAILKILAHDGDGLVAYGAATGITMCGLDAAAVALTGAAPLGYEAALLDYARSADREGDYSRSVSYAALVLCAGADEPGLTPDDRATLLRLARGAVVAAVRGGPAPALPEPLARSPARPAGSLRHLEIARRPPARLHRCHRGPVVPCRRGGRQRPRRGPRGPSLPPRDGIRAAGSAHRGFGPHPAAAGERAGRDRDRPARHPAGQGAPKGGIPAAGRAGAGLGPDDHPRPSRPQSRTCRWRLAKRD